MVVMVSEQLNECAASSFRQNKDYKTSLSVFKASQTQTRKTNNKCHPSPENRIHSTHSSGLL